MSTLPAGLAQRPPGQRASAGNVNCRSGERPEKELLGRGSLISSSVWAFLGFRYTGFNRIPCRNVSEGLRFKVEGLMVSKKEIMPCGRNPCFRLWMSFCRGSRWGGGPARTRERERESLRTRQKKGARPAPGSLAVWGFGSGPDVPCRKKHSCKKPFRVRVPQNLKTLKPPSSETLCAGP